MELRGKTGVLRPVESTDLAPARRREALLTINFLEEWLIATCLVKNPDLINNRKTKILGNIHVTGILNAKPGSGKNGASSALKRAIF